MKKIFKKLAFFFVALLTLSVGTDYTVNEVKAAGNVYEKVTSALSDWSGQYLIVYETGNVAFDGSRRTLDATTNTQQVTISNNQIIYDDDIYFTIEKSGSNYTIKSASGYYIGQTSNANGLKSSVTTKYSNTISLTSNGDANIVSGEAYLRYNFSSDQQRFRYYKSSSYSGQKAIQLYKLVENTGGDTGGDSGEEVIPTVSFYDTNFSLDIGETKTVTATISNYLGNNAVIISEDSNIVKVESNYNGVDKISAAVTGVKPGETNLKVMIDGNDMGVSISATVSNPKPVGLCKTVDFSKQGYKNADNFTTFTLENLITFKGDKGSNSNNAPKYYDTGTAVRFYGGNNLTISIEKGCKIIGIVLVYSSGEGSNPINSNVGTFVEDTWSGETESVVLTISGSSGHRRIKTITVYYEDIFNKFTDSKTYSQLNLNYRYEYELSNATMSYTGETAYMKGDNDASKFGLDDKVFDIRGTKYSGSSDITLKDGEIRMTHDVHSISINSIYVIDSIKFTSASEEYDSNKINILVNNTKVSSVVEENNKTEKYLINSNSVVISTVGAESAYRFTSLEITYRVPTEYKTFTTADVRYSTIIPSEIALFEGAKFGFNVNVVTSNGAANRSVEVNYSDLILNSDSSYTMAFVFKGIPDFAAEITVNGFVTIGNRTYNFDVCSYKTITSMVKQYVKNAESLGLNAQQIAVLNAFVENQNVTL